MRANQLIEAVIRGRTPMEALTEASAESYYSVHIPLWDEYDDNPGPVDVFVELVKRLGLKGVEEDGQSDVIDVVYRGPAGLESKLEALIRKIDNVSEVPRLGVGASVREADDNRKKLKAFKTAPRPRY